MPQRRTATEVRHRQDSTDRTTRPKIAVWRAPHDGSPRVVVAVNMLPPIVTLLVLRTADLGAALRFYRTLGLTFTEERHGTGPLHFAATLGDLVVELYPGTPGRAPEHRTSGATLLGLQVASLDDTLVQLVADGGRIVTPRQATRTGARALVEDPDGRVIELTSPTAAAP